MPIYEIGANGLNAGHESVVVNAPSAELYERWLRIEELPQFIPPLRDVRRIDDTHFSFAAGRDGREERGVIEVLLQIPQRRIAWRTIGEDLGLGVVSFEPRSGNTTEVALKLRSAFDPATSAQRAAEYLGNFKQVAENGSHIF